MNEKEQVCEFIDSISEKVIKISVKIHMNPELKFEEYKASHLLSEELEKAGFNTELGVGGLETAIRAVHPDIKPGPTVALIAEYDALPEIGHACGHNLIASAALGASLAVGEIKSGLPGKLMFLGTPAEEGGGGKAKMLEAGIFDNVDAVLMFHPHNQTFVGREHLAVTKVKIEFKGKESHASVAPERGINALDAVIQTFNGINALRQHVKDGVRIHGIITNGGEKPNIVPAYAAALFYVRASENDYRNMLIKKLSDCAKGASLATSASLSFGKVGTSYEATKPNATLEKAFEKNLKTLGVSTNKTWKGGIGSTDLGNVSQKLPAIHPYIAICEEGDTAPHTPEFAEAAISERGLDTMIKAAKALAMTTIDVLTNSEMVKKMKENFQVS